MIQTNGEKAFLDFIANIVCFVKYVPAGAQQGPIIIDFIKIASENRRFYAKAFVVKLQIAQYLSIK